MVAASAISLSNSLARGRRMTVVMSVTMRELLETVAVGPIAPLLVGVAVENGRNSKGLWDAGNRGARRGY